MAQVTDDWTDVDTALDKLGRLQAWRPTIAEMRRLRDEIRADPRFLDLGPSLER